MYIYIYMYVYVYIYIYTCNHQPIIDMPYSCLRCGPAPSDPSAGPRVEIPWRRKHVHRRVPMKRITRMGIGHWVKTLGVP